VLNNALEAIGFLCLVAFAYLVWPPLVLAVGGVLLGVVAITREQRSSTTAADQQGGGDRS
jgi:CHASE2 domain-containing sensor protein